jgi:3-hydroxymyristoyl/3-hydroxydecanoyl-(acyl carrier protein) dehydratase
MPTVPCLPQTPPFRLLDRIVEHDFASGSLVAEKQVSVDDALWPADQSHSPLHYFPQTLLIEALCQAAAAYNMLSAAGPSEADAANPSAAAHRGYLVGVTDLRFPNFVEMGQTLRLYVKKQQSMGALVSFWAEAHAIDFTESASSRQVVCGRLLFSLVAA